MDFKQFSTVEMAEKGVKLFLRSPFFPNDLLGEDVWVKVLGSDSKKVKRALGKFQRISEKETSTRDDVDNAALELLNECIPEWSGINYDGAPVSDIRVFFREVPAMVEQVMTFISNRENFLAQEEKLSKPQSEKK